MQPYPDRGESTATDFVARCKEHGVLAGTAELAAGAPSQGHCFERVDLKMLEDAVFADRAAWAADVEAVTGALGTFDLCTVYLQSLYTVWQAAGFTDADKRPLTAACTTACTAAWVLKARLDAGDGSAGPAIDERARYTLLHLLRNAWVLGADLGVDESAAVTWLAATVRAWTEPVSVRDAPSIAAAAISGGLALTAFLQWAVPRAPDTGRLPAEADTLLTGLVTDGRDGRALASIGTALTPLSRHALTWYTTHRAALLDITAPAAPIHTWLRHLGDAEHAVLGDLDPGQTMDYLRTGAPKEVFDRFAATLLRSPDTFGPGFLTELITGSGGPAAVSTLLGDIAHFLPREDVAGPLPLQQRAFQLWDQVLDLADAVTDAGHFVFAEGVDQRQWLARTLRTLRAWCCRRRCQFDQCRTWSTGAGWQPLQTTRPHTPIT
ncbi:hypothetical protein [Streptomyces sp. NPDC004435]|uniref:hypothetical protein n=1 Tax=Streptomyces sp. NPDC004435 TaxID=3364701 RepID=UPI0036C13232